LNGAVAGGILNDSASVDRDRSTGRETLLFDA
jgi:hypothetical protein